MAELLKSATKLIPADPVTIAASVAAVVALSLLFSRKRRTSYKGKTVVITGASAGIGEELAIQYARLGANLVLAARRTEDLNAVRDRCAKLGVKAIAVKTDVSQEDDAKNLVAAAIKEFGSIDVLLLNAGVGCLLRVGDVTDVEPIRRMFDINYWGCVYPTIHALPHLRKSKGTVIGISSLASIVPTPRRAFYGASKKAINAFFECLRQEEDDIQVTIVCPGFVMSQIHDRAYTGGAPLKREVGHFMSAETAANIIIDAGATGKQIEIMTASGKIGYMLYPFLPKIIQRLAKAKSERSVKMD
eukprot:TRINITY_DN3693_c0_g1_i1.p1 TRINITY_DN3693_c0_g1~~TRINITY_DN3693_c0_g1_i1.p1  ORF type:complete len:302 (-),score=115.07 TRINITY_DN3693_c0_g1_i1:292-1197(-)